MSYTIKTLQNNGNDIAPRTKTKAITDDDGNNLDTMLGEYVTATNDELSSGSLNGAPSGGGIARVELIPDPETGLFNKTPQEIYDDYWYNGIEYFFTIERHWIDTGDEILGIFEFTGEMVGVLDEYEPAIINSGVVFKYSEKTLFHCDGGYGLHIYEDYRIYDGQNSIALQEDTFEGSNTFFGYSRELNIEQDSQYNSDNYYAFGPSDESNNAPQPM